VIESPETAEVGEFVETIESVVTTVVLETVEVIESTDAAEVVDPVEVIESVEGAGVCGAAERPAVRPSVSAGTCDNVSVSGSFILQRIV